MSKPENRPTLLAMRGIKKSFPGVKALDDVDIDLDWGEVLALLGENGAGKSTLIKVLSGAHQADTGEILIGGEPCRITSPHDAQHAGIAVIYQEFNLVPWLTARENIFLGQERSCGFVRRHEEIATARELFRRFGMTVDLDTPCHLLSVAQQQMVEIAKALSLKTRVLVMDEPTATLTSQEVTRLYDVIRELKSLGIAIIYISHRLDEIFAVADRITVLRDGQHVATRDIQQVDRRLLIEWMVGRKLENEFPPRESRPGVERLVVNDLCRAEAVRNVSFRVRAGEILGLTGLVGAGRTELARLIFGADRKDAGTISLDGKTLRISNPRDAIDAGICLLSEDRKREGLIPQHTVRANYGLPNLASFSRMGLLSGRHERRSFERYVHQLNIKTSNLDQRANELSGGNQQKVVLAKWLKRDCDVIIFDEPTRGIDVASKYEIYRLMNDLAAAGKVILMISSELPEVLGMSDRILVMHQGRVAGEISDVASATQEQIMHLAVGEAV